jgi:hypothetical protein
VNRLFESTRGGRDFVRIGVVRSEATGYRRAGRRALGQPALALHRPRTAIVAASRRPRQTPSTRACDRVNLYLPRLVDGVFQADHDLQIAVPIHVRDGGDRHGPRSGSGIWWSSSPLAPRMNSAPPPELVL